MENNALIDLEDPESGIKYRLTVSKEDYLKAITDDQFANSLLFHAKINANTRPETVILENEETSEKENEANPPENESFAIADCSKTVYTWGYDQTVQLIKSMANHIEDLNHPKKRKDMFDLVANDIISYGYEVNSTIVQNKWKSLIKSYRKAKDNKTLTGHAPTRFMFYDLMDEILGDRPTNKCSHSLNSNEEFNVLNENITKTTEVVEDPPDSSHKNNNCNNKKIRDENEEPKRITEKRLRHNTILTKREEYTKRQKRHEERIAIEKEKLEIENKKTKMLEDYINWLKQK